MEKSKFEYGDAEIMSSGTTYKLLAPVEKGGIYATFSEISFSKQSIDCVLKIEMAVQNSIFPPFSNRIDLRSASARKSLATELNSAYGDKKSGYNWVLILNVIFNKVIEAIEKGQEPLSIIGQLPQEPAFLLRPFLQESSANLLFARSEAGKTWLALYMAIACATQTNFFEHQPTKPAKVLYLDYEDDHRTFISRIHKICKGLKIDYEKVAPLIQYYKPTNSLRTGVEVIKNMIARYSYDLIIIDAGGDATGGSPSDEEKVLDFFNALEELPVTKLILHHEPKYVVSEQAAFYGSMYWRARSRVAWRLEVENEDGGEKLIKASIQKRSNLPYFPAFYYKLVFDNVTFDDFLEGSLDSAPIIPQVRFEPASPQDVISENDDVALIQEKLPVDGADWKTISDLTGISKSSLFRHLKQMSHEGLICSENRTTIERGITIRRAVWVKSQYSHEKKSGGNESRATS